MVPRPKIYLDAPSWFCRPNSTDWQMKRVFVRELPELQASIVHSWLFNLVYSLQYVSIHFLSGRPYEIFTHVCACIRAWILRRKGAAIVISQGLEPPLPKGAHVVWETFFLDQTPGESDPEFRRGGTNMWVRAVERFGGKVDVIGVRGTYSVNLLKRMFPEYAEKVLNLGFVVPEYEPMGEEEIRQKQSQQEQVSILFVGRQARGKGLLPLLEAVKRLRADGVDHFRFIVISDFIDGEVVLPEWVDHFDRVPHDEVLRMMRRAHVFAMPSLVDSYGLVFLESLASGCVTFVPDREPQREFADYGRAGCVVNPASAGDIVEKLRLVVMNAELRTLLACAGRRHYEMRFSQEVVRSAWRRALDI